MSARHGVALGLLVVAAPACVDNPYYVDRPVPLAVDEPPPETSHDAAVVMPDAASVPIDGSTPPVLPPTATNTDAAPVDTGVTVTPDTPDAEPASVVTLGMPAVIAELSRPDFKEDDPTVTADGQLIFFDTNRDALDGNDIWQATRGPDGTWENAARVDELSSTGRETTPAISPDGLKIWFSRWPLNSQIRVMTSERPSRDAPWAEPTEIMGVQLGNAFSPRPSASELVLVFSLDRASTNTFTDLFYVTRASKDATWGMPRELTPLNTARSEDSGMLSADERYFFFSRSVGNNIDLFVAEVEALLPTAQFGAVRALDEINTDAQEVDPWVADGQLLFSSNRAGSFDLYSVELTLPEAE